MKKVGQALFNFVMYFVMAVLLFKLFLWALCEVLEVFVNILKLFV